MLYLQNIAPGISNQLCHLGKGTGTVGDFYPYAGDFSVTDQSSHKDG